MSWLVRDVPEGVSWWRANNAVMGNLILTSTRIVYEPHIPPRKMTGEASAKLVFTVFQRLNTIGHQYKPFVIELAEVARVEAFEVTKLHGAGAPMRIVSSDGTKHRLRILHRSAWRPVFAQKKVDERDRQARNAANDRLSAAIADAHPGFRTSL